MFVKSAIVTLGLFNILAVAVPNYPPGTVTVTVTPPAQTGVPQCNTGTTQCCNTVGEASSSSVVGALSGLGLLGGLLNGITGIVGLGCTPISVIGIGSGVNCAQQPVCCTGNKFNGLINIGCSPISL